jgi:bifunctional polynucleotide phosphatase/kinase
MTDKKKIKWNNTDEYLHGMTENFRLKPKIAMFDLDGTLIVTKSNKKFPINDDDWMFNYKHIKKFIRNIKDKSIIIVSNQAGIGKGKQSKSGWMKKISNIVNKLDVEIMIFCSTGNNKYRKPSPVFFNEILLNNLSKYIKLSESYYCGDAAGRKNDFSDCDYKFAINCFIPFKTPEDLFCDEKEKLPVIKYPNLYNDTEFNFKPNNREMIIMVGCPASGKSTISEFLKNKFNYIIINQDTMKTIEKCFKNATLEMSRNNSIIIDATNPSIEKRKKWIDLAKKHKYNVRIILMNTSVELSRHNNLYRSYVTDRKIVPCIAYNIYKSKYVYPETEMENGDVKEILHACSNSPQDIYFFNYLY